LDLGQIGKDNHYGSGLINGTEALLLVPPVIVTYTSPINVSTSNPLEFYVNVYDLNLDSVSFEIIQNRTGWIVAEVLNFSGRNGWHSLTLGRIVGWQLF